MVVRLAQESAEIRPEGSTLGVRPGQVIFLQPILPKSDWLLRKLVEIRIAISQHQAAAPFHRLVAVGESDAVHAQQGRTDRNGEMFCTALISRNRAQAFFGPDHSHRVAAFKETVY